MNDIGTHYVDDDCPGHHKQPEMVFVEWTDSGEWLSKGWDKAEKYIASRSSKPPVGNVFTAGFIMHEDDEWLYVSPMYDPGNDHWYGVEAILKTCIQNRVGLKQGKRLSTHGGNTGRAMSDLSEAKPQAQA